MKAIIKLANFIALKSSKESLEIMMGARRYQRFRALVRVYEKKYYKEFPNIGKSLFKDSYYFSNCLFFYFAALKDLEYAPTEAGAILWIMNEAMMTRIPPFLRALTRRSYARRYRRLGPWAMKRGQENKLHEYDWRVTFSEPSPNKFAIDIHECYVVKMAKRLGLTDIFPHVCRMDYLFSHYLGQGFERTMTLGDGDPMCDGRWTIPGNCAWPITDPKLK